MAEYCGLTDVKARMPELGTSDDTLLVDLVFAVSAYFDSETNDRFDSETKLQLFSGTGTNKLFIRPPLASVPTLIRVRDNAAGAWRTVPAGDVKLMPEGRRTADPALWLELLDFPTGPDLVWPEASDTVEITAVWGRSVIPDDIREACIQTVVNLYRSRGSAGNDEVGIGGQFMPDIPKAMPHFAYRILQNYKRLVYA
jgi:hypothetical protein